MALDGEEEGVLKEGRVGALMWREQDLHGQLDAHYVGASWISLWKKGELFLHVS